MSEAPIDAEAMLGEDTASGEVNQPGLSQLREAVANRLLRRLPGRSRLRQDALAGLSNAISNVPDGMANGLLVGTHPIHGLYAVMMGNGIGGLFSSTQLMMITTTSAATLATSQALGSLSGDARQNALFLMVLLIGTFQIVFGLLRLGRLIRFVSYSVMTGFLTGIAVLLALSQVPTVAGYAAEGGNRVSQALDVLVHASDIHFVSLGLAILTLVLAVLLPRTRLGSWGTLVAIVVPSVLVPLLSLDSVEIVRDVGAISGGIPALFVPSLSAISLDVLTGALAVSAIIVVQGAGVSQSVPNPAGDRRSTSRDFMAQGVANLASGFIRGLPVGGSVSATALNVLYGGHTRWSVILTGVWVAVLVLIFPGIVSYIAMPALGALLVLAGARSVKLSEMRSIWRTGWAPRLVSLTTFFATLFLPIQAAVGIGIVLSVLLQLYKASSDISVVELVKDADGVIEEHPPAKTLASNQVTVLDVYGSVFYAGARTLERLLPSPVDAKNPVVILRLRGRTTVGATLIDVLASYADKLQAANGRLYLSGISNSVYDQIVRTGRLRLSGPVRVYEATPVRGESTNEAYRDAQTWLVSQDTAALPDEGPSEAGATS